MMMWLIIRNQLVLLLYSLSAPSIKIGRAPWQSVFSQSIFAAWKMHSFLRSLQNPSLDAAGLQHASKGVALQKKKHLTRRILGFCVISVVSWGQTLGKQKYQNFAFSQKYNPQKMWWCTHGGPSSNLKSWVWALRNKKWEICAVIQSAWIWLQMRVWPAELLKE